VIFVVNHPSWWDPLIGLISSGHLSPSRAHFAPIEMTGLKQYPFLEKLGFFGVETGTHRGGLGFLSISQAIMAEPEATLWITAQGEFVDPRTRPVVLKDGIGHLAYRLANALIIPMALEYPFWNDRCPEALVRFGKPIEIGKGREHSPAEWRTIVESCLEECQNVLAVEARGRDPGAFVTILGGAAGVGGVYDLWRRFRSALRGARFQPEHSVRPNRAEPDDKHTPSSPADRVSTQQI
jgi:1-acyl-sn-glycerol-3-phosphate acyltransferase